MACESNTYDNSREDAPRLLLVDDDQTQRQLYKRSLEERGYRVDLAEGANAAVDFARRRRPDLIVLDMAMPERDGLSALQEFLDIDPSIPVIIHTTHPAYAQNFLSWAAEAYIEKSSDIEPLVEAIDQALAVAARRQAGDKTP